VAEAALRAYTRAGRRGPAMAGVVGAQPDDPRRARPQANDRFVFAGGNGKGRVITSADVAPAATAHRLPMDPATRVVRDESRLNQVLLVRFHRMTSPVTPGRGLRRESLPTPPSARTPAADSWDWQPASSTIKCPCHFWSSISKTCAILNGPATRRLRLCRSRSSMACRGRRRLRRPARLRHGRG